MRGYCILSQHPRAPVGPFPVIPTPADTDNDLHELLAVLVEPICVVYYVSLDQSNEGSSFGFEGIS